MDARDVYMMFCQRGVVDLPGAVAHGMIPRDQLVDGVEYEGYCRNATRARWDATKGLFVYDRTKFGTVFEETIEHPADDKGFDVFVPVRLKGGE